MQNATNIVEKTIKNCAKMVPRWYQNRAKMGAGRRRKQEKRWKHRREAPAGKERWESYSWRQKDLQMKLWVLKMANLVPTLLANRTHLRPLPHFREKGGQVASKLAPKTEPKSKKNVSKNQCIFWCMLEAILGRILMDFGVENGAKLGPKLQENWRWLKKQRK